MLDNYAKTMELVRQMKAHLPIQAYPASSYVRAMRDRGVKIKRNQLLKIQDVIYGGDEGGILCDITPSRAAKEVQLVSITHLEINRHHPLAREIRTYQRERIQKLKQAGNFGQPSQTIIRPRKKREE